MTIAFMCPDSFDFYEMMERELNNINNIKRLTCATTNTYNLLEKYCNQNNIELYRETRGGKMFNIRSIIQCADKVLIFEKEIVDTTKYSRTQKAIGYAQDWKRDTIIIKY